MSYEQLEILHFQSLTATVVGFKESQLQGLTLFPEVPIRGGGISAKWDIKEPSRLASSTFRTPTQPATPVSLMTVKQRTATCLLQLFKKELDEGVLAWLRQPGTPQEVNSRLVIATEQLDLSKLIDYSKELAIWSALTGTYSPTVGGQTLAIDYEIPATHKPATVTASWATAGTDIIADLKAWKKLIQQDSGYTPRHVWINTSVMAYLLKNTAVNNWLNKTIVGTEVIRTGAIVELVGLLFHVYDSGYLNSLNVFTNYIADDTLIMLPEENVYGKIQVGTGEVPVPGSEDTQTVSGKFSYYARLVDPVIKQIFVGQNWLPVIEIPKSIVYVADVTAT
jgi:hypothetical protein